MNESVPAEFPARGTPASIVLALVCFAFAVAAPFIGSFSADHAQHDGWGALRAFLPWLLAGAAAAMVGIVCTFVGAARGPRNGLTILAIVVACLFGLGFLTLLASMAT